MPILAVICALFLRILLIGTAANMAQEINNTFSRARRNTIKKTKTSKPLPSTNWSAKVTQESHALDLEEGVFTWKDPKNIARSLKQSADTSTRRKSDPYRSAMSMLVFYINRAGKNLDEEQKQVLGKAKDELRHLYGKD